MSNTGEWVPVDPNWTQPQKIKPSEAGWTHFDIPNNITTSAGAIQYALEIRGLSHAYIQPAQRQYQHISNNKLMIRVNSLC